MPHASWKPHEVHGTLDANERDEMSSSAFAYPSHRKEPLTDAEYARNALARFNQVDNVSNDDRDLAFANIKKAADHYGVTLHVDNWRQLKK